MKAFLKLLLIAVITSNSCSKYRVKTPYRIEATSTGEDLKGMQWTYKSSGVQGTMESYQGTSTSFVKEFTGTSKVKTSFTANCEDTQGVKYPITIKIYRKNKLVKEGSGSGHLTIEFNNL